MSLGFARPPEDGRFLQAAPAEGSGVTLRSATLLFPARMATTGARCPCKVPERYSWRYPTARDGPLSQAGAMRGDDARYGWRADIVKGAPYRRWTYGLR